ncbi:hypothetical protein D9Q98_003416 [Chlorella vulgaris]|uniref:Alkaline phosphatase n=1 Tax=Chlorella vulgaris TaxID=3077 RepID=A0A9D4YYG8_CHLVU|nr:hypothetical protein D9Q98_003416 [Chlorella vulgaris]
MTDRVAVDWVVSEAEDFSSIAASGSTVTDASRDFTVSVDATGLKPWKRYWYQFSSGKVRSGVGLTKTAPDGAIEGGLTFATCSCANWGFGRFHAYDLLSRVDDLDFVVHAGDYIYEYPPGEYPSSGLTARGGLLPKHKCKTLEDYRLRYACYRTDKALQELHRKVPMVAVWDDHETADNAHIDGSEQFEGSKEEWERRKYEAVQAFAEWVPVRGLDHAKVDLAGCQRTFKFGNLMSLMMVESRLSNRVPPVDIDQTDFYKYTAKMEMNKWDRDAIAKAADEVKAQMADSTRTMIGQRQLSAVKQAVQESVEEGQPWQVLISQTVFAPIKAPKLLATVDLQPKLLAWINSKALDAATRKSRAGKEGAELARMHLAMGQFGVPMNPGAWDGYAAERAELLKVLDIPGSNPVVMAGDSHNAWAHEISDVNGKRVAVEFDAPAVTSIGFLEDIYSRFREKFGRLASLFPLYLFTPWVEDSLLAANTHSLRYCNLDRRGFLLHHVTLGKFHTEFHSLSRNLSKKQYKHYCSAVFDADAGRKGELSQGVRYLTIDGKIPQHQEPKRSAFLRSARSLGRDRPGWR